MTKNDWFSGFAQGPALGLLFLLTSCTSTMKQASNALEAGNFEGAIRLYTQVLVEKPNDVDATSGLSAARHGYLSQKLIQVRMARLAGNPTEGLNTLNDIFLKEREWKLAPEGQVAFTQEEETGFALNYSKEYIRRIVSDHHPLQAEVFLKNYALLFEGRTDGGLARSRQAVKAEGKRACGQLRNTRNPNTPYFNQLVSKLCIHFGESEDKDQLIQDSHRLIVSQGIASTSVVLDKSNFSEAERAILQSKLLEAIKKTGWYHPESTAHLDIHVSGEFVLSHSKTGVVLVQNYEEPESYVENVTVTRDRQVPYTVMNSVYNSSTAQYEQKQSTQYRTETYLATEPQQKTRYVTRYYRYPAWKHEQTLTLSLTANTSLGTSPVNLSLSDSSYADGIEHDENQPAMSLKPTRPNLPDPNDWKQTRFLQIAQQLQTRASQLWIDKFCQGIIASESVSAEGDLVLKCLVQSNEPIPNIAEVWSKKLFGVPVKGLIELGLI